MTGIFAMRACRALYVLEKQGQRVMVNFISTRKLYPTEGWKSNLARSVFV